MLRPINLLGKLSCTVSTEQTYSKDAHMAMATINIISPQEPIMHFARIITISNDMICQKNTWVKLYIKEDDNIH